MLRAHGFNQRPRFEQVVGYLERNEPLPLDQPDRKATSFITSHFYLDDFVQSSEDPNPRPLQHTPLQAIPEEGFRTPAEATDEDVRLARRYQGYGGTRFVEDDLAGDPEAGALASNGQPTFQQPRPPWVRGLPLLPPGPPGNQRLRPRPRRQRQPHPPPQPRPPSPQRPAPRHAPPPVPRLIQKALHVTGPAYDLRRRARTGQHVQAHVLRCVLGQLRAEGLRGCEPRGPCAYEVRCRLSAVCSAAQTVRDGGRPLAWRELARRQRRGWPWALQAAQPTASRAARAGSSRTRSSGPSRAARTPPRKTCGPPTT